jgi:hypothetical protein
LQEHREHKQPLHPHRHSRRRCHVIELREDAFYEETEYGQFNFYWKGVFKVVRRPGFIGVYVSPYMAHIIPVRAFASRHTVKDFMQQVQARISGAK